MLTRSWYISGLSYASHTVGFTPPTSLTRAGMSYYNSPGLHVQHMGASHGITVSTTGWEAALIPDGGLTILPPSLHQFTLKAT